MIFGKDSRKGIQAPSDWPLRRGERKLHALYSRAGERRVELYGTRRSDRRRGLIDAYEFDEPLKLDSDDNAICPDLGASSQAMDDFVELRERHPTAHSWRNVTVERKSFLRWVTDVSENTATAATETGAIRIVAAALRENENLSLKDALRNCRAKYPGVSDRGFRSRIWPEARRLAGLPPKASPGRKPKSTHRKS